MSALDESLPNERKTDAVDSVRCENPLTDHKNDRMALVVMNASEELERAKARFPGCTSFMEVPDETKPFGSFAVATKDGVAWAFDESPDSPRPITEQELSSRGAFTVKIEDAFDMLAPKNFPKLGPKKGETMIHSHGTVYFNHGKESGPWGSKITKLADVARERGFAVESIDYQDLPDAGPRTERLLTSEAGKAERLILVGSSMGGYVATVASAVLKPEGLFLLAPAFYMPGYPEQNPVPNAKAVSVVHGWSDDVIPVEHSIRFARKFSATTRMELHLIEDDHRLSAELDFVAMLFGRFLDRVHSHPIAVE